MANRRANRSTRATKKSSASSRPPKNAKRSTPKTAAKPLHEEIAETALPAQERKGPAVRFRKSYAIAILAVIFVAALLYAGRGLFIAATVNGEPISRLSIVSELERQSGKQALDSMVTKTLILQEAKRRNVQVTEQDIDEEIKKIESNLKQQGQNLEQVLALQGLTRESLRNQVRIQKIVEELLGRDIQVTDKEVTDYIASNSATLPQDANQQELNNSIREQLKQQKLSERFQTWLAELRQNAKINYIVNY